MKTFRIQLNGLSPYMCHNVRLADPLDPCARALKEANAKRKKTESDLENISWLEFLGGLYLDEKLGPYIPGRQVEAAILQAARRQRRGRDVQRGLFILQDKLATEYEGPRSAEALFKIREFVDVRPVRIGTSRVMRTRPIFREWTVRAEVSFDETVLNEENAKTFVMNSGTECGVGELRPRYGRFSVVFL